MDRFIETEEFILLNKIFHLKSNMDRFIVQQHIYLLLFFFNLKSNMDRFIACTVFRYSSTVLIFKIQYGQIYSRAHQEQFKIQYGQIYSVEEIIMFVIGINLKSNMDRFIGTPIQPYLKYINYLKSNMDRFIEIQFLIINIFSFI